MIQYLAWLYGITGSLVVIFYFTQAYKTFFDTTRSESMSLISWGVWSFTSLVTACYAIFVVGDLKFIAFSVCEHIGCLAIFIFALKNRLTNK